jgi:predicted nucleotidyltransferase
MSPNELLHEKREDILRVASKRGASNVRVFGSVAIQDVKDTHYV